MRIFSKLLIFSLLLVGCQKQQADDDKTDCTFPQEGNVTLSLNYCAESETTNDASKICFEQLEDSRCPANVVCVWAGVAVAKFSLTANGTQYRFSLSTLISPAFPPNDTLVAGYRIKLLDVLPYPGSGAPGPVRAVLHIGR